MDKFKLGLLIRLPLLIGIVSCGIVPAFAQMSNKVVVTNKQNPQPKTKVTPAERKLAAKRARAARLKALLAKVVAGPVAPIGKGKSAGAEVRGAAPLPGGTPDYFGIYPNWALSPLPTSGIGAITRGDGRARAGRAGADRGGG